MMQHRPGMALAVTLGVVSLIAILAVATLSLAGRLVQTSSLGLRDAHLDAGVQLGLAAATDQWQAQHMGRLAIGSSLSFAADPNGVPVSVNVVVTRVAREVFWVVSEATAEGAASRRENLVLRARLPDVQSLLTDDSTNVSTLGSVLIDSLAAAATSTLPSGSVLSDLKGVVHVAGDATVAGGSGSGALIADGRLTITGPLSYEGVIVARGGITILVPGVTITGIIRFRGTAPNLWIRCAQPGRGSRARRDVAIAYAKAGLWTTVGGNTVEKP